MISFKEVLSKFLGISYIFYSSSAMKTCCFYTISLSFEKVHEILIYQQTQLHFRII